MNIKMATKGDLTDLFELDHLARANAENRSAFIQQAVDNNECYLFRQDGKSVAYFVFNYRFFRNGFLEMIYVKEGMRGNGIGSAILDYIETLCEKEKLFTSTNESNDRMHSLMAKKNFVRSGIIENLDEADPEIIYFKKLDRH